MVGSTTFLDHAAGSPLRPEVAAVVAERTAGLAPNPSGPHRSSRQAAALLEEARERVAAVAGIDRSGVVFTSGGTEACNLAVLGASEPTAVVISAVEHLAVRRAAERAAERSGVPLQIAAVDEMGRVLVDEIDGLVPAGSLVSVMAANNETGVVQPIVRLAEQLDGRALLHVDAVAAAPSLGLRSICEAASMVSISGSKLGGPAGSGALLRRTGEVEAQLLGGSQEGGRRAGTPSVAGALGLALALEACDAERRDGSLAELGRRRDRFEEAVHEQLPGATVTAAAADRLPGHSHLVVAGLRSEELLMLLDQGGIACSAGAACASGAPEASAVLLAMGFDEERARSALRFSGSPSNTEEDWKRASELLVAAVGQLRGPRAG